MQKNARDNKTFFIYWDKRQAANIIAEEAKNCGAGYVNHRWLGGMLTNWTTVQERVAYLKRARSKRKSGEFDLLPKKKLLY